MHELSLGERSVISNQRTKELVCDDPPLTYRKSSLKFQLPKASSPRPSSSISLIAQYTRCSDGTRFSGMISTTSNRMSTFLFVDDSIVIFPQLLADPTAAWLFDCTSFLNQFPHVGCFLPTPSSGIYI